MMCSSEIDVSWLIPKCNAPGFRQGALHLEGVSLPGIGISRMISVIQKCIAPCNGEKVVLEKGAMHFWRVDGWCVLRRLT
ncbi:MAG: hypothetical protein CVU41_08175 [Chloroflexi bacterium HGW-Chloroflexi-3]|nr:MAG: hypothetical protein CVU41_08175 [Chloroflexi bacterium HGW-Chloroflexi-3]